MNTKVTVTGTKSGVYTPPPPIAVIGLSGILPEAENINQYWENILNEINCIKEVPPSRWSIDDYYDPDPTTPDKTYSKHGGFIPDINFDPMEFGLPPNLLEVTDVSQLLSLIVAKNALKDAGYLEASEAVLNHTGVILGMVGMSSKVIHPLLNRLQYPVWEKVLQTSSIPESEISVVIEKMKLAYVEWNENAFPGAIGNVVAGRIANRLDLGGTNCIVDAACGSSLAAVSMAISELALGRAEMMITGGVDTDNSILTYLCFSKTPAFSKGGRVRTFSAESDGMLTGEGIGMLVLKRLEDAERDNDRIYSIIRGVGSSSDGHFKSIYAPRSSGQAKAIRRAYEQANYKASTVRLIEAHGTGTIAGDPAEFDGLREVFCEEELPGQIIALGSVKSQIGHTKATAGAASLIKASLALHQQVLPATINITEPHPAMEIESTPFYLNTETRPWFEVPSGSPRRVGVSAFGFGGTNFHIALEEYQGNNGNVKRRNQVPYSILLFEKNPQKLLTICRETFDKLQVADARNVINQLDRDTSTSSIPIENCRVGFIAESIEDAREKLQKCIKMLDANDVSDRWFHPQGIYFRKAGIETTGKTVALFPGQGSQYVNMGRELALNFRNFREVFEQTNKIFSKNGNGLLTNIVYPIPVFSDEDRKQQSQRLTDTRNAQPAIGTLSLALLHLLSNAGFQADHYAGHSFGELTALCASGVYDRDAFIRLAIARGAAMSSSPSSDGDSGTMIAVKGDVEKLQEILEGQDSVTIANFNSLSQVVLAGSTEAVAAMKEKLEGIGFTVYPLQVSAAFHTSFVEHAKEPFQEAIQKETFNEPIKAVYSNSTAKKHMQDPKHIARNLAEHILNSVRFKEEIENIYQDGGSIFIEIGPKKILSNLVKDILKDQPHEIITLNPNSKGDSDLQFRQAVVQMRVLGFEFGNVDPSRDYQTPEPTNHSKVTVTLNGGLYKTQKTRDAFQLALKERTSGSKNSERPTQESAHDPSSVEPSTDQHSDKQSIASIQKTNSKEHTSFPIEESQMNTNHKIIESLLEQFQEHQNGVLKAHQLFLKNDGASKEIIQEITSAELAILSKLNGNSHTSSDERALSLLEKRIAFVNDQQNGSSKAHQDFIRSQSDFTQQYAALISEVVGPDGTGNVVSSEQQSAPIEIEKEILPPFIEKAAAMSPETIQVSTPSQPPGATEAQYNTDQLAQSFLEIVSDKTGYPTDMLELNMDMEADLGIDSIKRVEILGAMQEEYPKLPTILAEDLAILRTLEQIISAFNTNPQETPQKISVQDKPQETPDANRSEKVPMESPANADLQVAFLDIVSEKTGYPADMLELEMDMEADLGIDSIKRVEILGAIQEKFPHLPTIEAEELVTLRTLDQIIQKFSSNSAPLKVEQENSKNISEIYEPISEESQIELHDVRLKTLPRPDYLKFDIPDDSLILVTDDGTEKSHHMADFFTKQNVSVGMIHFSDPGDALEKSSNNGLIHYYIPQPDETEVQACMQKIIDEHEKISAFIHLNPASNGNGKSLLDISEKNADILKSVFLLARHLGRPLAKAGEYGRSAFLTVTQMNGQLGLNGVKSNDPIPGGFSGLTKSLRYEWPNVFCRAIDIHPEIETEIAVKLIDAELHDPDIHLTEVGYTTEGRYTLSID
jgi:polyketide-type polyunsaturated fatty acid synthase PfaA